MDGLAQCFLWIDESPTEQENDRIVRENAELQDHIQLLHAAFGLLPVIIRHATHRDSSELAFLRLGIRLFNSAGAAFKLVRSGYYQSALAAIRDVVEIQFLLDLFRRDQQELADWVSLSPADREKQFKPVEVRRKLDAFDGYTERLRGEAYKLFCQYGAHPTPEGFCIISPEGWTQIGPFPSEERVIACIQELAKHFPYACLLFSGQFTSDDAEVLTAKARFLAVLEVWRKRYLVHVNAA
jgi:hypothetical protein